MPLMNHFLLFFTFFSLVSWGQSSCENTLKSLLDKAAHSGKARLSKDEIPTELRPIIDDILKSGTRTLEQHKQLARAVVDYLKKNGIKAKTEAGFHGSIDIRVEEASKNSPFKWTVNVPAGISRRFNFPVAGLFNTDHILNPFTPGLKGGSAQFRSALYGNESAIVFSAKSLMTKQFHSPTDGHEVIHARTKGDSTPHIVIEPQSRNRSGKVGADLYGSGFSTDEIHSAYAFSVRTSLRGIEPSAPKEEAKDDSFTEVELTTIRNGILQDLYQTAQPVYEAALQRGGITQKSLRDHYGWGGDRALVVEANGNSYWLIFNSKQVNRWKLEQDPSASKKVDWSKDSKTIRAMIARDYAASKQAAKEADLFVQFLTGPKPEYSSFREAADKISEIRDFSTMGDSKANKSEKTEAAARILARAADDLPEGVQENKLISSLLKMQQKAQKLEIPVPEGSLALQRKDGTWITVDATKKRQKSAAQRVVEELISSIEKRK